MNEYETPIDVANRIRGSLELTESRLQDLAQIVWHRNLDPTIPGELEEGLSRAGLDPADFGFGIGVG